MVGCRKTMQVGKPETKHGLPGPTRSGWALGRHRPGYQSRPYQPGLKGRLPTNVLNPSPLPSSHMKHGGRGEVGGWVGG
jgi:hypothetical protein